MNPIELAKKIEAVVADYDLNTAHTALEIVKLLVMHRETAKLDFNQSMISSGQGSAAEDTTR